MCDCNFDRRSLPLRRRSEMFVGSVDSVMMFALSAVKDMNSCFVDLAIVGRNCSAIALAERKTVVVVDLRFEGKSPAELVVNNLSAAGEILLSFENFAEAMFANSFATAVTVETAESRRPVLEVRVVDNLVEAVVRVWSN